MKDRSSLPATLLKALHKEYEEHATLCEFALDLGIYECEGMGSTLDNLKEDVKTLQEIETELNRRGGVKI